MRRSAERPLNAIEINLDVDWLPHQWPRLQKHEATHTGSDDDGELDFHGTTHPFLCLRQKELCQPGQRELLLLSDASEGH